jgi:polar amino acid transport system substrate-binding protein
MTQNVQRMLLLTLASGLCACNSIKPSNDKGGKPEAVATIITANINITPINRKKIPRLKGSEYWSRVRKGTLRIIIGRDSPPFSMRSKDGKERLGFDVELAKILGKTLGVKIEFIALPTSMILDAISGRRPKGDIAIANLTRTASRGAQVNFTSPYLTVSQAAIIDKRLISQDRDRAEIQTDNFNSYADLTRLRGIKIGVKSNTTPETYARSFFPNAKVVSYKSLEAAFEALEAGEVQAVTHDSPAIRLWSRNNSGLSYRFAALLKEATRDPICMAIRKGDFEFLQWLDTFIAELQSNGTMDALRKKYIVDMSWLKQS